LYASLDAKILCPKIWPNLCAGRFYTALYCASHVILLRYRTPFHSYGLVTGTFPEHSRNPIYSICICATYFLYPYNISEIFLSLLSSSLVDGWLVENWRCNMYYLGLTHLITKKCAILQPNYCVRGWRCIMYYHGWPIYTMPKYIPRKV